MSAHRRGDARRGAARRGGLIEGEDSEYGLFVKTVDGITANEDNQEWWSLTIDGEMAMTGVDSTPSRTAASTIHADGGVLIAPASHSAQRRARRCAARGAGGACTPAEYRACLFARRAVHARTRPLWWPTHSRCLSFRGAALRLRPVVVLLPLYLGGSCGACPSVPADGIAARLGAALRLFTGSFSAR